MDAATLIKNLDDAIEQCYDYAYESVKRAPDGRQYIKLDDGTMRSLETIALCTNMAAVATLCSGIAALAIIAVTTNGLLMAGGVATFAFFVASTLYGHGLFLNRATAIINASSTTAETVLDAKILLIDSARHNLFSKHPDKNSTSYKFVETIQTFETLFFPKVYAEMLESRLKPAELKDFDKIVPNLRAVVRRETEFANILLTTRAPLTDGYLSVFEYASPVKA